MLPPSTASSRRLPGAGATPLPTGRPGASAKTGAGAPLPRAPGSGGSSVVLPTEDGGYVTVREPVKTIGRGDEAIELRTLSPEEKARRKLKKNLVLWGFGLLIIGITLVLLLFMGPLG